MLDEITYFTDRHPKLSCAAILAMITAVPMLFVYATDMIFGEDFPSGQVIFLLAFLLQLILCFKVERFIFKMMPFFVSLIGVLVCEGIYVSSITVSQVTYDPVIGRLMYTLLLLGVAVFGPEAAAAVGGLMVYAIISFVRGFFK